MISDLEFLPTKLPKGHSRRKVVQLGQKYGLLTVVEFPKTGSFSKYICDCGSEVWKRTTNVVKGITSSCGTCGYQKKVAAKVNTIHGCTSNGTRQREYIAWSSMFERCNNPNCKDYHNYGGRGIRICSRWSDSFIDFLSDMGPKPTSKHSLDRFPNKNGDYEPGNCRWATQIQQTNNIRKNRILVLNGESHTMSEWSRKIGLGVASLWHRITKLGWDDERVLTEKVRGRIYPK